MSYSDLLTTTKGRDMARNLVSAIINMQIGQNLSVSTRVSPSRNDNAISLGLTLLMQVDAISDILQQRCGSFCSADDVLLYKAIESIRKAKSSPASERLSHLRESLRLFNKASTHLSSSKLSEAISEYNALEFPLGAIDLAMTCSNAWDPDERGLSWWRDGKPKGDSRAPSWEPREFCYDKILESLSKADELLDAAVEKSGRGPLSGEPGPTCMLILCQN